MLKTLIKAQLFQMLVMMTSSGSKNKKRHTTPNNTVRNAIIIIGLIVFALVVTVALLSFAFFDIIFASGFDWVYFSLFATLSFGGGAAFNVFIACTTIFSSKDNNMLLSMPISPTKLLISRTSILFFNCMLSCLCFWFPAVIVYVIRSAKYSVLGASLLMFLIITLSVLILAIVIGWVVSLIVQGRRAKSFLTILITLFLVFVGIGVNVCTRQLAAQAVADMTNFSEMIEKSLGPVATLCKDMLINWVNLLPVLGILIVLLLIVIFVVQKTYFNIMTRTSKAKTKKYVAKKANKRSLNQVLLSRERSRFVGMTIYLINAGLGVIFALIMMIGAIAVTIYIKSLLGISIAQMILDIVEPLGFSQVFVCVIVIASFAVFAGLNAVSTPSVSVEGNSLWVIKSLPVPEKKILNAKENFHAIFNFLGVWLPCVISLFVLGFNVLDFGGLLLVFALIILIEARFGIIMSVRFAKLDWKNPAVPVKQSVGVLFSILLGFALVAAVIGVYFVSKGFLASFVFIPIAIVMVIIFVILGFVKNRYAIPAFKRL